jgi:thioredoxin 1
MASPHVTHVNETNFEAEVLKSDKLVLIDFSAEWCGPCKALAPTLEKFAEDNKAAVKVVKIDVDESPRLAQAFGVQGMPTLLTIKARAADDGRVELAVVGGLMGNQPRSELDKLLADSLLRLSTPAAEPPVKKRPSVRKPPTP